MLPVFSPSSSTAVLLFWLITSLILCRTGAVKLTPGHDPNDFELGKKHNLDFINILTDDGKMNSNTGKFEGQKRFDARYAVIEELKKLGLYDKWENNAMKVPLCSKSKGESLVIIVALTLLLISI
jgi:valyl-tRNA synthetase